MKINVNALYGRFGENLSECGIGLDLAENGRVCSLFDGFGNLVCEDGDNCELFSQRENGDCVFVGCESREFVLSDEEVKVATANKGFLDITVGSVVSVCDEYSHDYDVHDLFITSIEFDDEYITKTNPKGMICYGEDLSVEKEDGEYVCDEYLTVVTEEGFLGFITFYVASGMYRHPESTSSGEVKPMTFDVVGSSEGNIPYLTYSLHGLINTSHHANLYALSEDLKSADMVSYRHPENADFGASKHVELSEKLQEQIKAAIEQRNFLS